MIFKDLFIFVRDKMFFNKHVSILMYHSVDSRSEFFAVSPRDFRWQMSYLKSNKYNVIPLSKLTELLKDNLPLPPKTAVITFDDGYADNLKEALPVLKEYKFPATIFLTTGLIGNKNYIDKRGAKFEMLDWTQIEEMHKTGLITFEPHTISHPKLTKLELSIVEKEMLDSKKIIEEKLGSTCHFFAYPKGDFNKDITKLSEKYFLAAVTVRAGFVGNLDKLSILPRQAIDSAVTHARFKLKI